MSQSLPYHAFGIPKTYRYVRTEYQRGEVWFSVRPEEEPSACPHCGSRMFYGLRDDDFLRLKLYALHESKHKLVG